MKELKKKSVFYGRRTRIRKTQFVVRLFFVGVGAGGRGCLYFVLFFVDAVIFFFIFIDYMFLMYIEIPVQLDGQIIHKMFYSTEH